MKLNIMAAALLMLAGTILQAVPADAGRFTTRINYYTISGSNARQIHNNMTVPRGFFSSGDAAYANISFTPKFAGRIVEGRNCRFKGFQVIANFTIRLPRLSRGVKLPRRLSGQYKRFLSFITRHEYRHRRIYQGCIARVERQAARMRAKNCSALSTRFAAMFKKEWSRCKTLNARFDASERSRLRRQPLVRSARAPQRIRRTVRRTVLPRRSSTSSFRGKWDDNN